MTTRAGGAHVVRATRLALPEQVADLADQRDDLYQEAEDDGGPLGAGTPVGPSFVTLRIVVPCVVLVFHLYLHRQSTAGGCRPSQPDRRGEGSKAPGSGSAAGCRVVAVTLLGTSDNSMFHGVSRAGTRMPDKAPSEATHMTLIRNWHL